MIFITSYPYIGPRHIRVFDFFKKKDDIVFILPKIWKMKNGKVIMKAESRPDLKIIPARTFFFHSHYPVVRGHLKGWTPAQGRIIRKMAKPGDILFTVSEPNLLMTYLSGRLAKKLGLRHVFFTWQNVPYKGRMSGLKLKLTEKLIRKNISLSSGGICGNTKAFDVLAPFIPDNFKTVIAPISGLDIDSFRPGINSDFRAKNQLEDKIVLTFIGALDKRKGITALLNSFIAALSKEPRLRLVMIGAGPLEDFIKNFISEHKIENKIIRMPWQENERLPEILCGSDIFIYPSRPFGGWEEQFGYSVAEASACGLPVISTNSGAIPDKVINGVTGFLVDPDNNKELVESILKLALDQDLRKKMGEAGRQFIVDNFSHKIIAEKIENFLRHI